MLAGNGRKFLRGPRGTGFLYMHPELIPRVEPVMLDLHAATWTAPGQYEIRDDARRFEMWESDVAARIGLGVAVDHALGLGHRRDRRAERHAWPRACAPARRRSPASTVHDRGEQLCAITTFTVAGVEAEAVRSTLRAQGVNVSVTVATSAQLDLPRRGLDARGAGQPPLRHDRGRSSTASPVAAIADGSQLARSACGPAS